MTSTALRMAVYSRVSTMQQTLEGYSLGGQDADCEAYAAKLGATVAYRWTDNDSGAEWDLPGHHAMLDAARKRDFDVLIVFEHERLARNRVKQAIIESELRRYGVDLRYVKHDFGDNPEGQLQSNIMADFTGYEREKIAFRTARGRRLKAEKGIVVGNGPAPTGYVYTYDANGRVNGLAIDPQTAPIIQRIFRDAVRMSVDDLCLALDAEGVPTRFSHRRKMKGWSRSTVLAILRNPACVGRMAYGRRRRSRMQPEEAWLTARVEPLVTVASNRPRSMRWPGARPKGCASAGRRTPTPSSYARSCGADTSAGTVRRGIRAGASTSYCACASPCTTTSAANAWRGRIGTASTAKPSSPLRLWRAIQNANP